MSLKMTEQDWAVTLEVFRACLPTRGAKAKDDRLFLEALHFFAVHNITWRALPEQFGKWNTVWKRFDRLSKAGVFDDFFAMLAGLSETAHLVQMFDSTVVRAHLIGLLSRSARCSVPECDGISICCHMKEELWARYSMEAPRRRTLSELRYSDRRLRSRS